jgi:hypothetical protein
MRNNIKESVISKISSLCRKAELTRDGHANIANKFDKYRRWCSTIVVIGSALTAMFIFADFTPISQKINIPSWLLRAVAAGLSVSVFLVGQILLHNRWEDRIEERRLAVDVWGKWIREARVFLDIEVFSLNDEGIENGARSLNENYISVMGKTPQIPNSDFLQLKYRFREKLWISKQLDDDTGKTPKQLRKEYRDRERNKSSE